MGWLSSFFSEEFMPHGYCYLWDPRLVGLHAVFDAIIAVSYYTIPLGLLYFVLKRPDFPFLRSIVVLFGTFILACGTTHLLGIVVLWHPFYWVDGGVKAVTAAASIGTAVVIWHRMPVALAIPSNAQLQDMVDRLSEEVATRERAEADLRNLNTELEERVRARTSDLEKANEQLQAGIRAREVLLQELHHRVKNNLQVVSGLLTMQSHDVPALAPYFRDSSSRVEAMGRVHEQLYRSSDLSALNLGDYLGDAVKHLARIYGREDIEVNFDAPRAPVYVTFESATAVVLILNEALSNVFKHAFPDGTAGEVSIAFERDAGGMRIIVADNGVGLSGVSRPGAPSMGMKLMQMLANQIRGEVEVRENQGKVWTLHLPTKVLVAG